MSNTVDRLDVELTSNAQKLMSDFQRAESVTNDLERELEQTERASADLADEMSKTGSEAKELEKQVESVSDELDDMADKANKAAKETDDLGDKSDDSGGKVSGMFDKIKGGAAPVVAAIGLVSGALVGIGTMAVDAADQAREAMQIIAYETGLAGDELEKYSEMAKDISLSGSHTREDSASAVAKVWALNRDADEETIENLSKEYLSFIALNPEASIDDVDAAFKKWGVSTEEQADYLRKFNSISQSTTVDIATLVQTLADGDRAFQMMGMSMEQAAAYIGEAKYAGEIGDVRDLTNALEMLQAQMSQKLGSDEAAAEYIGDLTEKVKAMKDESEAIAYLTSDAVGLGDRVARAFAASMFSGAEGIDATLDAAKLAVEESLVDVEKKYETTGDVLDRIGRNIGDQFEILGEDIRENMLYPLDEALQLINSDGWVAYLAEAARRRGEMNSGTLRLARPNQGAYIPQFTSITINQEITSADPIDGAAIERSTQRAANAAGKSLTSLY